MNSHDDCPNTNRLLDWMDHCKVQHADLKVQYSDLIGMMRELQATLSGNGGREGLVPRVARNSQRIDAVDEHVKALRVDVDKRFEALNKSLGHLNIRFWRMAITVAVIITALNSTIGPMIKSAISTIGN